MDGIDKPEQEFTWEIAQEKPEAEPSTPFTARFTKFFRRREPQKGERFDYEKTDLSERYGLKPPSSVPLEYYGDELLPVLKDKPGLAGMLKQIMSELDGRRSGYEFYPSPAERQEIVTISDRVAEYLHTNNIKNFILLDRSARPAYIGVKEMWKQKYPDEPMPDIYFLNPSGFVNTQDAQDVGRSGFLPKGLEMMMEGQMKGNDLGNPTSDIRSAEEIQQDFEETYEHLVSQKDEPTFIFDTCIHSGNALEPVLNTMQSSGFADVKIGTAGNDMNSSGIKPDFVAVQGTPLGVCYPFDHDKMVERRFDSVSSRPNPDGRSREEAARLRKEISRIFNEANQGSSTHVHQT